MQLSQTNAYAVAAMIRIASLSPGQLASCHEICRGVEMPERYVLQLLRKLVNAGVIRSTRGRDGGFRLAKPAAKVSLLEIIEAIDGRLGFNSPVEIAGLSTAGKAVVAAALTKISTDARKSLAAITLADLQRSKAA